MFSEYKRQSVHLDDIDVEEPQKAKRREMTREGLRKVLADVDEEM